MNAEVSSTPLRVPGNAHPAEELDPHSEYQFASSVLSNLGVAKIIAQHYDLGGQVRSVLLRRLVNDTYRLTTAAGAFVLKVYRVNVRTEEAIVEELAAINHLSSKGIQVATPVWRKDGELITRIFAPEGLRHAVVFNWVNGNEPEYAPSHLLSVGRALAELHVATDDLKPNRARPRIDLAHLFERPLAIIHPTLKGLPHLSERFEFVAKTLALHVKRASAELDDWGFCHGDYDPSNMSVAGSDVCVFDFDWCGTGWRIYDLATFTQTGFRRGHDLAVMQPLIDGYLQVRPGAAASVRFALLFSVLRHVWIMEQSIFLASCTGSYMISVKEMEKLVELCERGVSQLH